MEEHYAKLKRNQFRTSAVLEKFPEERDFLELSIIYPRETMLKAFALAREYNTFS